MRAAPLPLVLLSSLALSLALAVGVSAGGDGELTPDGLPVIDGTWTGKIAFKFFPLDPAEAKEHGKVPATLTIVQTGADLAAGLDVTTDEGPLHYDLAGVLGNANFWLAGTDPGEPLLLSGHVKGKAPKLKLKGTGLLAGAVELNELRFSLVPAP